MARITCAISGIRFDTSFLEGVSIPHTEGYFHPIFALPYRSLHMLYYKHCRGELTSNDSYLLFIAFLHSSDQIAWNHPATLNPNDSRTKKLIENNLSQLIKVIEKSFTIQHPSFQQPSFKVSIENCFLEQIPNWIKAWEDNIYNFNRSIADIKMQESLQVIENKLTYEILSGTRPERYAHIIAEWADKAGNFPPLRAEEWKRTIRSCFNITKMFNTPLTLLKEIKEHCESNIEVGSIHFHALTNVLKEGISRHVDYLGGSSLALGYTFLPTVNGGADKLAKEREQKNEAELLALATSAPEEEPRAEDYPDSLSFLRAKLAYRVASNMEAKERNTLETINEKQEAAL